MTSSGGKLLQLCDNYLTNKPNITLCKCVYAYNTNFSTKTKRINYNNFELTNEHFLNDTIIYMEMIGSKILFKSKSVIDLFD